jgi:uncharacterized protein involved in cysteine biosynthesis
MLGLGQLGDPAILRVLGKSLAITLIVFIGLGVALYQALIAAMASWGTNTGGSEVWLVTVILMVVAIWFLFRIVALAVLQFFADDIVRAVELRHYPEAVEGGRDLPFSEDMSNSLKSVGRALLFNAMALPVAILLLFTAIGPAVVFLLVNAVLLGRELTDMAWFRHRPDRSASGPVGAGSRLILGACVAGMMLIPFVNLLAPVIGAAAGTHMVHQQRRKLRDNA